MKQPMGGGHKAYKMSAKVMKAKTGKLTEKQKKLPAKLQKVIKA